MLKLALTLVASLFGAHLTYWLTHRAPGRLRMGVIRAASLTSILYVAVAYLSASPVLLSLQAAVFGSTFVAMSEPYRLSEKKVLLASFVFGLILFYLQKIDFLHYQGGMGGTLGGSAFVACLIVYALQGASEFVASKLPYKGKER